MASEALKRAIKKYDENNTVRYYFKFNKRTDADIIEKLEVVENRAGYIKELIRRDLGQSK